MCVPLRRNGGIVCLGVVKYLLIFQKEGSCRCKVRRKDFHFVFFSCWSLMRKNWVNRLTPNDPYMGRTAPLASKRCIIYIFIQQIQVLNILNMLYTLLFFSLQNAVCFIMLTCLVLVLITFYIQDVLKLKIK